VLALRAPSPLNEPVAEAYEASEMSAAAAEDWVLRKELPALRKESSSPPSELAFEHVLEVTDCSCLATPATIAGLVRMLCEGGCPGL
jgi:hypothetical protein